MKGSLVVKNVDTLYTPSQVLKDVSIVIENGRFKYIGKDVELNQEKEAEVIDGSGLTATPGLIDPCTHIGIYSLEDELYPHGVEKSDVLTPYLRVVDAVNPFDRAFRDAIEAGVTTVGIHPGSYMWFAPNIDDVNIMPGMVAIYRADGRVLIEEFGIVIAMGEHVKRFLESNKMVPTTRMGIAAAIRNAFRKAHSSLSKQDKGTPIDPTTETLVRVLRGELAVFIHAYTSRDIAVLVNLLKGCSVKRMIVVHGIEAWKVSSLLRETNIPVVLGPIVFSKRGVELKELDSSIPLRLEEENVLYALTTDHPTIPVQYLSLLASVAVGEGLDRIKALESITIRPAKILGIDNEFGSVEVGKVGDLVLWDGDPLDPRSRVVYTIMNGDVVYRRE